MWLTIEKSHVREYAYDLINYTICLDIEKSCTREQTKSDGTQPTTDIVWLKKDSHASSNIAQLITYDQVACD